MTKDAISNFHTHTKLCKHAVGMPLDYAAVAAKEGCTALGFSDHCPYPDIEDDWANVRMNASEAPSYIAAVRDAAAKSPFPVKAGFECEWDKDYKAWYEDGLLGTFHADYLVLGPHWVTIGREHIYIMSIKDKTALHRYVKQNIEGIQSGLFAFVAHPDLFMGMWHEWDAEAQAASSDIIDAAISCGLPLEVNGLGMKRHSIMTKQGERYQYPYLEFWQLARDKGAKVICNSDAHNSADVIKDARHARDFARMAGFESINSLPLAIS